MVPFHRILRDHRNAGALNGMVALWGFLDDHTFLTKAGAVGTVFRLHPPDAECLDHDEREVPKGGYDVPNAQEQPRPAPAVR